MHTNTTLQKMFAVLLENVGGFLSAHLTTLIFLIIVGIKKEPGQEHKARTKKINKDLGV